MPCTRFGMVWIQFQHLSQMGPFLCVQILFAAPACQSQLVVDRLGRLVARRSVSNQAAILSRHGRHGVGCHPSIGVSHPSPMPLCRSVLRVDFDRLVQQLLTLVAQPVDLAMQGLLDESFGIVAGLRLVRSLAATACRRRPG